MGQLRPQNPEPASNPKYPLRIYSVELTRTLQGSALGRPDDELTTRIALVDFDGAKALSRAEISPLHEPLPERFAKDCCFKVIEATDKLCEWMVGKT